MFQAHPALQSHLPSFTFFLFSSSFWVLSAACFLAFLTLSYAAWQKKGTQSSMLGREKGQSPGNLPSPCLLVQSHQGNRQVTGSLGPGQGLCPMAERRGSRLKAAVVSNLWDHSATGGCTYPGCSISQYFQGLRKLVEEFS